MAKAKESLNPFYVLVIVLGIAFAITAFAYSAMAYRAIGPNPDAGRHVLMTLVNDHGVATMAAELVLLAGATFGAIWLDGFRARQNESRDGRQDAGENKR